MDARKRFYKSADVATLDNGYTVELDGRPVRTPMGNPLSIPTSALAQSVAAEWQNQGDTIIPPSMPLNGMVNTAIDKISTERTAVEQQLLKYAETDLLCYRAGTPEDLDRRQHECWQPLLDWAFDAFGAELVVTRGILPVTQPKGAIKALHEAVSKLGNMELSAVAALTADCGSLVVALAVFADHIDPGQACHVALLDEAYQSEHWGLDKEAEDDQRRHRQRIEQAGSFLYMIGK